MLNAELSLRDQIMQNALVKQYFCDIDIAHLISYNEELAHRLNSEPAEIIPLVCGLRSMLCVRLCPNPSNSSKPL